jgi:hypothetical protein
MSYIIAFISYSGSDKEFPVQCFRTDLEKGDEVFVRRADGEVRTATIQKLEYLNWDCNGRIECRLDESSLDANKNILLPKGSPLVSGMSTHDMFVRALKSVGWVPIKSRQRMYRSVLANTNNSSTSYIFVRKNGLDIQVLPRTDEDPIKPYSFYEGSFTEGRVVRHSLAHTTFNLFEGVLRFSTSFLNNEKDLERYFVPQGSSDKRTEELKEQSRLRKKNRDYDSFGDLGDYPDDMYLGYHMK